jgi:uncharacterized membrane protein
MSATARRIGMALLLALFALQVAWHVVLVPPAPHLRAATWSLALLPLAATLAWCLRSPRRGLLLGGFVGLPYFVHGVVAAMGNGPWRGLALAEVVLTVGVVASIGWATAIEKRAARA